MIHINCTYRSKTKNKVMVCRCFRSFTRVNFDKRKQTEMAMFDVSLFRLLLFVRHRERATGPLLFFPGVSLPDAFFAFSSGKVISSGGTESTAPALRSRRRDYLLFSSFRVAVLETSQRYTKFTTYGKKEQHSDCATGC
jgi:hypothetical protein